MNDTDIEKTNLDYVNLENPDIEEIQKYRSILNAVITSRSR